MKPLFATPVRALPFVNGLALTDRSLRPRGADDATVCQADDTQHTIVGLFEWAGPTYTGLPIGEAHHAPQCSFAARCQTLAIPRRRNASRCRRHARPSEQAGRNAHRG